MFITSISTEGILQILQNYKSEFCGRVRTEFSFLKEKIFLNKYVIIVRSIKQKKRENNFCIRKTILGSQKKNFNSEQYIYLSKI